MKFEYNCQIPFCFQFPRFKEGKESDPSKMEAMLKRLNDTVFHIGQFAAGDRITLADISIMASLTLADLAGYRIQPLDYPHLITWMKKIKAADFYAPINVHYKQQKAVVAQDKNSVIV